MLSGCGHVQTFNADQTELDNRIIQAAENGSLAAVKSALAGGAHVNARAVDTGMSPLLIASESGG